MAENLFLFELAPQRRLAVGNHLALDDLPGRERHPADELRHRPTSAAPGA
jgi:hypothetical protein